MKNMLKGIIISSALIGGYSVAEEMIHPDAYVAQAASYSEINDVMHKALQKEANRLGKSYHSQWFNVSGVTGAYISTADGDMGILRDYWPDSQGLDGNVIGGGTMGQTKYAWCNNGRVYQYTSDYPYNMGSYMTDFSVDGISICQRGYGDTYGGYWYRTDHSNLVEQLRICLGLSKPKPQPSKTYSYKGMLTAKKSDYSLFANKSFSEKKGYTKAGRTYYAKGYFDYDGKRYYSLYQKDSKGQTVWRGYADSRALTEVKSSKVNKKVMMTGKSYTRWQDLYFSRKLGTAKKSQVYYAKQAYTVGNGKTYYTLYQDDKAGKSQFKGYVDSKGLTNLNGFKVNKQFIVKKGTYNCWDNLYFSKSKGKSSKYVGKIVTVKYGYKLNNGKTYYSLYDGDKWLGYIEKPALVNVTQKKVDQKMVMKGKKYTLWRNLAFSSKKGYATKGQTYQAKRLYTLEDGKKYYSLYKSTSNGKWEWKGYVDSRGLALVESK